MKQQINFSLHQGLYEDLLSLLKNVLRGYAIPTHTPPYTHPHTEGHGALQSNKTINASLHQGLYKCIPLKVDIVLKKPLERHGNDCVTSKNQRKAELGLTLRCQNAKYIYFDDFPRLLEKLKRFGSNFCLLSEHDHWPNDQVTNVKSIDK